MPETGVEAESIIHDDDEDREDDHVVQEDGKKEGSDTHEEGALGASRI